MFIAILVFQVSQNLVVNDTAYSVGRLVFWWSQSGLYATAVGWESVYSWCDPVRWLEHWIAFTVKPFFPGVDEPSGTWWSIFHRWKCVQVYSVSIVYHCSWIRKSVFMVWFTINGQNIDFPSWQNRISRCWGAFWSLVEQLPHVEKYSDPVS